MGEWTIVFKAHNSELDESSNEVSVFVRILEPIFDVDFIASSVSVVTDEIIEFTISLSNLDDYTCIIFKSGDGSMHLAFGNEDVCTLYYDKSSFKYIKKSSNSDSR